jgi:hypothetical protein
MHAARAVRRGVGLGRLGLAAWGGVSLTSISLRRTSLSFISISLRRSDSSRSSSPSSGGGGAAAV